MKTSTSVHVAAMVVLVAACGTTSDDPPSSVPTDALYADRWQLTDLGLDGVTVDLAGTTPTLVLSGTGEAQGSNGCNSYFASVIVGEGTISFRDMGSTEIGCEPAVAAVEQAFMTALGRVDGWSLESGVFTLFAGDGSAALAFEAEPQVADADLPGEWALDSIGDAVAVSSIVAGTSPGVTIVADGISGSAGCNRFDGTLAFDTEGGFDADVVEITELDCPDDPTGQQEATIVDLVNQATSWETEGDFLLISTDDGRFLRFVKLGEV